jgi:hypothetical protein
VPLQLEIFPDEEIRVVNANQVPDDDYASVFDGVAGRQLAQADTSPAGNMTSACDAFRGTRYVHTLLLSHGVVNAGKRKAREVETGFRDTALQGSSVPAAAVPPQENEQRVAEGDTQGQQMPQQQQQQQGHV